MRDIVERWELPFDFGGPEMMPAPRGKWVRYSDYEVLRQQVEKARAQGRDEGLEEAAKVADPTLIECECCRDTRIAIAAAIRALKSGEGV